MYLIVASTTESNERNQPLNKPGLKNFLLKLNFLNTSYCKMVILKGKSYNFPFEIIYS